MSVALIPSKMRSSCRRGPSPVSAPHQCVSFPPFQAPSWAFSGKDIACLVSSIRWEHRACVCVLWWGGRGATSGGGLEGPRSPLTTVRPASFRCFTRVYYEMFHPTRLPYSILHSPALEGSPANDEASALPTDAWATSYQ